MNFLAKLFTTKHSTHKTRVYSRNEKNPPPYSSTYSNEKRTFHGDLSQQDLDWEILNSFQKEFESLEINKLSATVLTNSGMKPSLVDQGVIQQTPHVFSEKLELEGNITNQKSSGRCWLFAATNIMRLSVMKKFDLAEFELSQNYLFFYDKLEKSNYFLEKAIELAVSEDDESRVIQTLFQDPISDGGQWDMLVNIVEKYGVVPKAMMPETHHSSRSREVNWVVTRALRANAIQLRNMINDGKSVSEARTAKIGMMNDIYRVLVITLGAPPRNFTWDFRNKNGKFFSFNDLTPKSFYDSYVKNCLGSGQQRGVGALVSLVNDPRHPYYRTMSVKHLGNVYGGNEVRYINVPIEDIKEVACKTIQSGTPVWFGCDVGKHSEGSSGVMDLNVINYGSAFGIDVVGNMSKAERLKFSDSAMTHAMVFTGVHLNEEGTPVRWRVENSWGEHGQDGFEVMADSWFDAYTYQIVVDEASLKGERLGEILCKAKSKADIELPIWDPMGSLA